MAEAAVIPPLVSAFIGFVRKQLKDLSRKLENLTKLPDELTQLKTQMNRAYDLLGNKEIVLQADNTVLQYQVYIMTNICYDAEDLTSEMENKWPEPTTSKNDALKNWSRHDRIEDLRRKLDGAIKEMELTLKSKAQPIHSMRGHYNWRACPDKLVGRDEDIKTIVSTLTSHENCNSFGVSIVGMNGVGKSALAHEILKHPKVLAEYPLQLWASLSGLFDPREIVNKLEEDYLRGKSNDGRVGFNQACLNHILQESKWVIVLDNLLGVTSSEDWFSFWGSFHHSARGKILITTLNHDVIQATRTTKHYLNPLSDQQCGQLISDKLGVSQDADDISTLAQKCHGLPLVANFLVHQLSNQLSRPISQEDHWRIMLGRDFWGMQDFKCCVLPLVASNYLMLQSHHLKKCFSYFSIFPHGYQFQREDLIQLWIGQKFIECSPRSSLEDIGEDYIRILWKWSILQAIDDSNHDGHPGYEIHKFTHKLAEHIGSKTCLRLDDDACTGAWDVYTRHLSLSCQDMSGSIWDDVLNLKRLRTILTLQPHINIDHKTLQDLCWKLVYLRVLALNGTSVDKLPGDIKRLRLLRYLDVSNTPIIKLPEALSKLLNLQILKLNGCPNLYQLPNKFKNLVNLRHIGWDIATMKRLTSLPSSIGNLTCLQTLPLFTVGEVEGYSISELKDMNHLKGSLLITNLEKVKNGAEAAAAMLSSKTSLERLELEWGGSQNTDTERDVFTALEPHASLKELRVTNYYSPELPQWLRYLNKLKNLYLKGCQCHELPPNHQSFPPALESLTLKQMPKLRDLRGFGTTSVPRLRYLVNIVIMDCPSLTRLPSFKHLTSLLNLQISECAALALLPELPPSLGSLIITQCDMLKDQCRPGTTDWPKIKHIQNIVVDGQLIPTSDEPKNQSSGVLAKLGKLTHFIVHWRFKES